MILRLAAAALISATPAVPALAGGGIADAARLEVLDGGMTRRGTYLAALHLTLPEGWKTYWRAPGDAGIPPHFDWRGSRNLGDVAITWPAPEVFEQDGMRSIGYAQDLVLPIEITPGRADRPVRLRGEMELGLCKDVCIPETLTFDHRLDETAGRHPAIAAAMAQRPHTASEAGVESATCRLTPTAEGMRIEARIAMPSAGGQEYAVIEPGDPRLWASQTRTGRDGATLLASGILVQSGGGAFALDRSRIRITVLGSDRAVDILGCLPG
ncbi:MAG: protein-disulfide reductase DsbD domain-containing protein [Jhaorihella sp.]